MHAKNSYQIDLSGYIGGNDIRTLLPY